MKFEWDRAKARANLRKHGVSFDEAASVLRDPLARIHDDPDHDAGEHREIIAGRSTSGRLLLVCFTERDEVIRLSAPAPWTPANVAIMKKTPKKPSSQVSAARVAAPVSRRRASPRDNMRPHYDFDYTKSRSNRFASRFTEGTVAVVLDPDVASIFGSSEAVNTFLRSAITAMSASRPKKKAS